MTFLVSYDIPSTKDGDRRRARIARLLEGWGLRVQYSIFEVDMPPEKLTKLTGDIEAHTNLQEDSIRIYPLCGTCKVRAVHIGVEAVIEQGPLLIW